MLGVVRSPWLTTLMQVSSRIVLVWGFMWAVPSTQGQLGSMLCITSWACVEIPRYLFYTFGVLKSSPYPLFYLRYSLFAVLYPTGIAGEVMTMLAGLPDLKVGVSAFHCMQSRSVVLPCFMFLPGLGVVVVTVVVVTEVVALPVVF
ncbi:unnamed protein product, partial [Ectocarpus sp. 13 AM-2016]